MLYILKQGSSVLFVVSSAVCLSSTDVLYMKPFLAGPKAAQTFTIYDGFALFVLVRGMLIYHSENEERRVDISWRKAAAHVFHCPINHPCFRPPICVKLSWCVRSRSERARWSRIRPCFLRSRRKLRWKDGIQVAVRTEPKTSPWSPWSSTERW